MAYARLAIYHSSGKVFLVQRCSGAWGGGCYFVPGGKLLPGLTAHESAQYHALKEAGVHAQDITLMHTVRYHSCESTHDIWFFRYIDTQSQAYCADPVKFTDGHWFDMDHLPDNLLPAHRQALILGAQSVTESVYVEQAN